MALANRGTSGLGRHVTQIYRSTRLGPGGAGRSLTAHTSMATHWEQSTTAVCVPILHYMSQHVPCHDHAPAMLPHDNMPMLHPT